MVAFARVSDKPIRLREPIMEPDAVLIQDRTLLESVNVFSGLTENAYVLLNSSQSPEELGLEDLVNRLPKGHVITRPPLNRARPHRSSSSRRAMLAGFAALTGKLKLESVQQAFQTRYKGKVAQANADVAADAYSFVLEAKNRL